MIMHGLDVISYWNFAIDVITDPRSANGRVVIIGYSMFIILTQSSVVNGDTTGGNGLTEPFHNANSKSATTLQAFRKDTFSILQCCIVTRF